MEYEIGGAILRRPRLLGVLGSCLLLGGCNRAPSQDVFGSFYPAWLLCALGGILLTLVVRQVAVATGVHAFVPAKLLIYAGLAFSLTFIFWLAWFAN